MRNVIQNVRSIPAHSTPWDLSTKPCIRLVAQYREERDPKVMLDGLAFFEARLGAEQLDRTLLQFADQFPTVSVYQSKQQAKDWLAGSTNGIPNRAIALEELMMLWLANANPAFKPYRELFNDQQLAELTSYPKITAALRDYFETRPKFGPENQNLFDMLRAPALASPDSLTGQLAFIRQKWTALLREFVRRLLTAIDVLKEEETAIWLRFHPPTDARHGGPGWEQRGDSSEAAVPKYRKAGQQQSDYEYEAFSPDVDWMPRTVMLAKSTYVWLDQLSKQYGRDIHRLNHIPNEELDTLARRGFNALWLIGLWERSRSSQKIKQMCGNPDAVASAYSLLDYSIAEDLGGESAYMDLRDRAGARGIRLASDMVPNHMGIDSHWVINHPDWFISLPQPPYPAYSFNGPDVSHDDRVEIKIEDHYFDRTDAAVVFRRTDRWTGDTRYIYHGNDGTSFPWNDTAQLNYLKAEVREGVTQTILHVARMFPIIRFDAAMTLTKLHYQRLWFPEPGTGGAIPSRAEHGLTKEEFDKLMPTEFWRDLVDRVAREVPGTLLLAEAFWLLEGYFVRTLGMHRVYNSAFMNMMRDEENANYRSVIKNTLEFDPEVLKRYVNFMNNPDERTAVDQFGKGDKYFGVCTMMAALPGLPMFGHGQVEGFRREVRDGISPRLQRRAARPVAHCPPRARNISAACTGARCLRRSITSCSTTSTPTPAPSTKTCTPSRTVEETSARWLFTTIVSQTPVVGFGNPPPTWTRVRSRCARRRSANPSTFPLTARCTSLSAMRSPDSSTCIVHPRLQARVCMSNSARTSRSCTWTGAIFATKARVLGAHCATCSPDAVCRAWTMRCAISS